MATAFVRVRRKAGAGAFYLGMSLIVSSIVLNIAYDRLPGVGPEALPPPLPTMYEQAGKHGVTAIFVGVGLAVMLFGFALPKSSREQRAEEEAAELALPLAPPATHEVDPHAPATTPDGQIILRTQQYMRRKSGPSK